MSTTTTSTRKTTKTRTRTTTWVYNTATGAWRERARTTPPAYPHIRLLPPPRRARPEWGRYPGMTERQVYNAKFVARMEWLESLGLNPFLCRPLIRRVK